MPRRSRMYLPDLPYHVVQRGNNRQTCFREPENFYVYLKYWREIAKRYGVKVHAYCLMSNHIHFLVSCDNKTGLSETMRVVGSRFARYINQKYDRTGTLWEGRHRSSLVQSERYFLTCMQYIELNPVRAKMVTHPHQYQWSSYASNALGEDSWIETHAVYQELGKNTAERCRTYQQLFRHGIKHSDLNLIRQACHFSQPVADEYYKEALERQAGITFGQMKRGRPFKTT